VKISSTAGAPVPHRRRKHLITAVRVVFVVLMIAFVVVAVATQWQEISAQLRQMSTGVLLVSGVAATLGVFACMLCWRVVLSDLGSPLQIRVAGHVYFVGQLGKYIPGSIWAVVAQVELARVHDVPRTRTGSAYLVFALFYAGAGLLASAVTLPFLVTESSRGLLWLLLLILPLLVVLYPPVLTALLNRALRLVHREPLEHALSARGVAGAMVWGAVSWVLLGVHIWLIARDLGGSGASLLPLSIGGFALAWVVGFLVIIAPAGVGPRDAIIAALFVSQLPAGGPAALALVSRLILTFADVACAVALVAWQRAQRTARQG